MQTLTPSGAGVLIEPTGVAAPNFATALRRSVDQYRFAVLKGACATQAEAVTMLGQFGPINQAVTRKDGAVVVEDRQDDEVFRSSSALPLHKDGVLTGFDIVLVGIYCIEFQGVTGGRTYVSDAMSALATLPSEYVDQLRENGVEGMAVDESGYYRPEYGGVWHPFPAFRSRPGRSPGLNIGMRHAPGEPESWRIRVANVAEERSDAIMDALRTALLDEQFCYFHEWEEGDMLVLDNYAVLHGREAFQARARKLANIQVLSD